MKIGILDDRPEERTTAKRILNRNLNDGNWSIVDVPLLRTPAQIVEWLIQEEVQVLIADQILSDNQQRHAINYQGHQVIEAVRQHLPNLPVYMLTAFHDRPEVTSNLGKMEEMVVRGELAAEAPVLVERMKRAGASFEERNRNSLSRLSELSAKKATERLSAEEQIDLNVLQTSMDLADTAVTRAQILPELEAEVDKLTQLSARANALLRRRGRARR